jgi:hypothetical protein
MPSTLVDLSELVGFFSYSREDDTDSHGALSALRHRIQGELRGQLGRTATTFRLWQDKEAIASGTLWETEIKNAVAQSVFFIPIITPTVIASQYCQFELHSFLARESELGRGDLVFPILYIDVPALRDAARREKDPVLSLIAKRQYVDWRKFRHQDVRTREVSEAVEHFCTHIRDALDRSWVSPQERREQEETAARRQADREQQKEAEARAKEVEARQRAEAVTRSEREAEQARIAAALNSDRQKETNAEHRLAQGAPSMTSAAPSVKSEGKKVRRLVIGGAMALFVLAGGIVAWSVYSHHETGAAPATASTNKVTCGGDTDCLISTTCNKQTVRSSACSFRPVCVASLLQASSAVDFDRYLGGPNIVWRWADATPHDCTATLWGPDSKPNSDDECSGDCMAIYYSWSGNLDTPSVEVSQTKQYK